MKKLLLVAGAGLVGIYVAKKVVNKMKAEKEVQEIIEQAEELVNEELEVNDDECIVPNMNKEGKVVNDNIQGVSEVDEDNKKDMFMLFIEIALEIYIIYLGCKFYKLMINEGIVKGCKLMLEKVGAYIIAMLSMRGFRFLALGK